jgi:hypothetical protein
MSEQTFGAWLLDQHERQDTTGNLARTWRQLKDANSYKHSQAKSIRELLSAYMGENWEQLRGDEAVTAAETEWKNRAAPTGPAQSHEQLELPVPEQIAPSDSSELIAAEPAVLVVDGREYELTPGRRYVLDVRPTLRPQADPEEARYFAEQHEIADDFRSSSPQRPSTWAELYAHADQSLPTDADLVSLGLTPEE